MIWMVNESLGTSSLCRVLSQSMRGTQYGMTLNRHLHSVGFFQSWHGLPSLTFLIWGPTRGEKTLKLSPTRVKAVSPLKRAYIAYIAVEHTFVVSSYH